ncbi:hypothetical protein [Helicobacter trogontum]|uniref:hypothetical protein n=1 Tax=Helicobacter trogontum TaxID=50960 RepID=UPI00068E609D|nr:hypothetical protein [Helicobacter trogontum]
MTTIEKRLQRKKNLIKVKKILKKFTILFLIGIIYLIGIPLYVVFIIIPLVLFIRFKYNIGSVLVALFLFLIFYYTPYSYYLEPSYWQFRNMCKLKPEIYQANGGKLDEEYYNKVLKYFDTDLDNMSKSYKKELGVTNDKKYSRYWFETWIDKRTNISFEIWFKSNIAIKDNIDFSIKPFLCFLA